MSWRRIGSSLGVLAFAFFLSEPAAAQSPQALARPNILLIMLDDLGTELSIYGHPLVSSPSFERLAARALRFDGAYVQATICNPSRTSLLTGLRPDSTGILTNKVFFREFVPEAITLPRLFRQNGYVTASVGKIFHGVDKGWQDPEAWDRVVVPEGPTLLGRGGKNHAIQKKGKTMATWRAAPGGDEDQKDGQHARDAILLLESIANRSSPFFLAVGLSKPHEPYVAPKRYFDLYRLREIEPPVVPEVRSPLLPLALPSPKQVVFDRLKLKKKQKAIRAYYAATSFADAQLGRILDALDRLSLWRNTVVVVVSDHGFHLGEHGWWGKRTVFEESARVPLLVYKPGMRASGESARGLVEVVDIYPTLAELGGLEAEGPLDGTSFVRLLNRPGRAGKAGAYTQVQQGKNSGRSVRTRRWRYTEWNGGDRGVELYDHSVDPGEYLNLAELPEFDGVVRELKILLEDGFGSASWFDS
ncbi:MAG: sulfatase [bacterium]|nr:sulfatase [bacterium]